MGFDLPRFVPEFLLSIFILIVMVTSFADIGAGYNTGNRISNSTFDNQFNNTLTNAQKVENTIRTQGADPTQFSPGTNTLFPVWDLIKSSISDTIQVLENFAYDLGGGPTVVLLKTILTVTLATVVAFIIFMALLKIIKMSL